MDNLNGPGFVINPGWVNAPGFLGFAPPGVWPMPVAPIAFVTNPISYAPRRPAHARLCHPYPGGLLLHTGWPNPGFRKAMQLYARRWSDAKVPVWVHLLADRPDEMDRMVRKLEEIPGVEAVQISFTSSLAESDRLEIINAGIGEIPLIVQASVNQLGQAWIAKAIAQGVSAISLGAPRGVISEKEHLIEGRLYGPGLFPQGLLAIKELLEVGVPVVGGMGVYDWAGYDASMDCGARAVQLDTVLWRGWDDERKFS